jgi:hypothetical protein
MFNRFIKTAAYGGDLDKFVTALIFALLVAISSSPVLHWQLGASGVVAALTSGIAAFTLAGVRYWATKTFEYKYGAEPASVDRVPSLMNLSARALPYARAREHMEKFAEVDRANDKHLAAAVVERYPEGLDRHLELIAQKAWLKGDVRKQYGLGPEPARRRGLFFQLER